MRAIIPAAGVGRRLRPFTIERPKGLVEVGGVPILVRTLAQLARLGIDDVVCVTGHHGDMLERELTALDDRPPIRFVHNPVYATTNSIVSLGCVTGWWDRDFCIVDSDVLVCDAVIERTIGADGDVLAIDTSKPVQDIEMRVEVRDGRIAYLDHDIDLASTAGEFFGISRWTPTGGAALAEAIAQELSLGHHRGWYEWAIREAASHHPIGIVPASTDEWAEVDAPEDIPAAEALLGRIAGRPAAPIAALARRPEASC
jgi:choline kinase